MRTIHIDDIKNQIAKLCVDSAYYLGNDVIKGFSEALDSELSQTGKDVINQLICNAQIARDELIPICQDCGLAVIFIELGQEVSIVGGDLYDGINDGVSIGYQDGYLRKSTCDPFTRNNYGNNLPAIIHVKIVSGDKLKLTVTLKGGGSENMSRVAMLSPSAGRDGVINFVVDTVRNAGPNPCPPIIVGVGIGGNFEEVTLMAKEALLRDLDDQHQSKEVSDIESELLDKINNLGIGPGGLGGTTTALAVKVNMAPCHIASLPVAVNINCHAQRHRSIIL